MFCSIAGIAGCATLDPKINQRFIGKTSDAFFVAFGVPKSTLQLNDGGKIYTWRGGENTIFLPGYQETVGDELSFITSKDRSKTSSHGNVRTTTTISQSRTKTISLSGNETITYGDITIRQFCEAQIVVNSIGVIVQFEVTGDTRGNGFNRSRCAEVLNSKQI